MRFKGVEGKGELMGRNTMQLRKKYRRQRTVVIVAFAAFTIFVSAILNLLTVKIMEQHVSRPTVYEVKYVLSEQDGIDRFESLRG